MELVDNARHICAHCGSTLSIHKETAVQQSCDDRCESSETVIVQVSVIPCSRCTERERALGQNEFGSLLG